MLRLARTGTPISAISEAVVLSAGTVRNLLSFAIAKTASSNRVQAAQTALRNGWI